jgi:hypothetical protein
MTDEVQQDLAEAPAPEQVATAAPEAEVTTPETPKEATKTFTQEELDAAIGKRLAREQRKWEREQAQRQAEQQVLRAPADVPPVDQFESPEAYAEALALKKAEELIAKRDAAKQIQWGAAAPATGTWNRGDKVINAVPSVGSPKGWVCTVSGSPGTWVSEGNL